MTQRRSPLKTYEITWTHPSTGKQVLVRIRHTRNYLVSGTDHIEVESIKPPRTPLPITETGFMSHFIDAVQLRDAEGPERFVERWIEREQQTKAWKARDLGNRQGDLFKWADARDQVAKRKKVPVAAKSDRPKRPAKAAKPKPRMKPTPK
jgi:hypothetical protein